MQARSPMQVVLFAKSVASQFFANSLGSCALRRPQCQARISFALLSIPMERQPFFSS
jgi:hypothetical protein